MMSNIATLMSKSFLDQPDSARFMFVDVFWALAMATNVYLTFYHRFDGVRLRIKTVIVHTGMRALTVEWDTWQLATYGLIWLIIFIAFSIYFRAGITIYKWMKRLNSFLNSYERNTSSQVPQNADPLVIAKTTKITISTSDSVPPDFGQAFGSATRPEPVHSANIYTDRKRRSLRDEAAMSYAKTALLFFTAMLITWIPASANRLYVLVDGKSSVPLGYLSAFVLPLPGFWNALIYYYTSRAACKQVIASLRTGCRPLEESDANGSSFADGDNEQGFQLVQVEVAKKGQSFGDTESTTSLTAKV
ncbi:G coupled receptor like [Fusarium agapanthi]|uniref:G coupled receptor like n=1 Tax=Fusarium agapanthi TaxID=1803897 RepID=A0A9P5B633_9HYPO|nr:G coupled receptor like [Fusarium agapanthi]